MNNETHPQQAAAHYNEHAEVYEQWSRNNNAGYHFGIWLKPFDMFNNNKMVQNLNDYVLSKIQIEHPKAILDAGCGAGHLMALLEQSKRFDKTRVEGVTISKVQAETGKKFLEAKGLPSQISVQNFESTTFADKSFDTIIYLESLTYGAGAGKDNALKEAARLVAPGGLVVIIDAFLTKELSAFGRVFRFLGKKTKGIWAIQDWNVEKDILESIEKNNFDVIENEDLKWRMSPSMLHVLFPYLPMATIQYWLGKIPRSVWKIVAKTVLYAFPFGMHPACRYKCLILKKRSTAEDQTS